ncbi:MAG: hypothetical protein AB7E36_03390 [Salinivirgaceae bacterium]
MKLNTKILHIAKNFSYTLSSQSVSFVITTLVILVVPKLVGVEQYGYWQLYLFYTAYIGFLHFGWNDGIYLKYGGAEYQQLDKKIFYSQFLQLLALQLFIGIVIYLTSLYLVKDVNRLFILKMTALCLVIVNTRYFLLFTLQATNRFKEFALITFLDRGVYALLIVVCLVFGVRDFRLLVITDIIGKLLGLGIAIYFCSDIVLRKIKDFSWTIKEAVNNVAVGINLMFAAIASKLLIGTVRLGIERHWEISVFGKVSLVLSISNMLMLFINAVGLVIYPVLRRSKEENLSNIYVTMRDFLMVILLGMLVIYYPAKETLTFWLPNYADSLQYMALLFPITVYEGKMALLINTYLKTLRKEKLMLKINLIALLMSVVSTATLIFVLQNLNWVVVSITFLLAFRCILAELLLSRILKIKLHKDIVLELLMTTIFVLSGWFINSWIVVLVYSAGFLLYLVVKQNDIRHMVVRVKQLVKVKDV